MEESNKPVTITLPGPRLTADEVLALEKLALQNLESGNVNLVLDCGRMDWVDSSLLGILVSLNKKTRAQGGMMVICQVNNNVLRVFRMMRLEEFFIIRDTEDDALKEFAS